MPGFEQLKRVPFSLAVDPEDRFRLRGSDAPDFLHRLSASEARDLTARHLVFTDDKGSLVDAPLVVRAEDGFHLIASPGRGPALRAWFEKWIITSRVAMKLFSVSPSLTRWVPSKLVTYVFLQPFK